MGKFYPAVKNVLPLSMEYFGYFNILVRVGNGGFSLVGSLVAAGLMGGLALLLANMTKQQHAVQKSTETHFEVNSLLDIMVRTLYNGDACKHTLGDGVSVTDNRSINFVKNKDGGVVFNTTDNYGNNLLRIESMTLKNTAITGTSGAVDIRVVILKLSKSIKGYKKVVKDLPITFKVAAGSTNLSSCHHTVENLDQVVTDALSNQVAPLVDTKLNEVIRQLCPVFGGTYDTTTQSCSRTATP